MGSGLLAEPEFLTVTFLLEHKDTPLKTVLLTRITKTQLSGLDLDLDLDFYQTDVKFDHD